MAAEFFGSLPDHCALLINAGSPGEIHLCETAALKLLRDRAKGIFLLQDFRSIVLGVLGRPVAEALGGRAVIPVAASVVRHAPDSQIANLPRLNAAHHELRDVLVAEPRREM